MSDPKQVPRTTPAKLEELTAGRLSPDSRRKIRRAFGEGAMQALEDCRLLSYEAQTQQSVLARELVAFQDEARHATKAVNARVTGSSEWCAKNEKATAALERELQSQRGQLDVYEILIGKQIDANEQLRDRIARFEQGALRFMRMTLWQRVRWMLGGTVPDFPPLPATVTEPRTPEERETFAADIGRP